MKKIYVLWSIAIATLCANVFFACKSDDTLEDFYRRHGFTVELVKTPDFVVYSDGNVLASTLATKAETRGEGADVYHTWDIPAEYSFPTEMSESDKQAVLSAIASATETTTDATDYFVEWVGCKNQGLGLSNLTINGSKIESNQYYWNKVLLLNTPLTNVTFEKNGVTVSGKAKLFGINGGLYLGVDGDNDNDYSDWVFRITPVTSANGGGDQSGTDVQVNGNYYKVQDWENTTTEHMPAEYAPYAAKAPSTTDRGENVSQAEYDYVMAYLAAHPDEGGTECDLTTYFIQNVGSSYFEYKYEQFPTLKDHNNATYNVVGGRQMDFVAFSKHRNDYNAVGGPRALCVNIPIEDPTYHDSWGDMENTKHNAYRFYVIEFNGEKNLYLCYDYQTKKNSGVYLPGDKVFNDWVIKIIPAEGGNGGDGGDDDDDDEKIEEHITNIIPTDEVEVNLSVNDEKEKDDYIATKLSIHVRSLTDVEVFIPVEEIYYCDVDDMAIVLSHKLDINYQYSNPDQTSIENGFTYTYTVAGEYIKDGVTLTANEAINVIVTYEAAGIRVKTQGINQVALDYLQYTYQDGITFEVWNYFNSEKPTDDGTSTIPVTRSDLKPMFDQSTVTFTASDKPSQYVNAFAMLYDYKKADLHVYMKDNKPYLLDVTLNAEGRVISETPTDNLLASSYWVANEDGTFKEFVGDKNEWDCVVSPSNEWTKIQVNNGKAPANYNEIYTK